MQMQTHKTCSIKQNFGELQNGLQLRSTVKLQGGVRPFPAPPNKIGVHTHECPFIYPDGLQTSQAKKKRQKRRTHVKAKKNAAKPGKSLGALQQTFRYHNKAHTYHNIQSKNNWHPRQGPVYVGVSHQPHIQRRLHPAKKEYRV